MYYSIVLYINTVSYTHLDVYKRQEKYFTFLKLNELPQINGFLQSRWRLAEFCFQQFFKNKLLINRKLERCGPNHALIECGKLWLGEGNNKIRGRKAENFFM